MRSSILTATATTGLVALVVVGGCLSGDGVDDDPTKPTQRALPGFDAAEFEPEESADTDHWDWPEVDDFRASWNLLGTTVDAGRIAVGEVAFEANSGVDDEECPSSGVTPDESVVFITEDQGYKRLLVEQMAARPSDSVDFGGLTQGDTEFRAEQPIGDAADGDSISFEHRCGTLTLHARHLSDDTDVEKEYWADHVYATTLLESGQSVFEDVCSGSRQQAEDVDTEAFHRRFDAGDSDEIREAIDELFDRPPAADDSIWERALDFADEAEDDELALRIHRHYGGMQGGCDYSEAEGLQKVCERLGDTGCALKIALNFRSHTERDGMTVRLADPLADLLEESPVDGERFLRGLVMTYADEGEMQVMTNPWRIGLLLDHHYENLLDEFLALAEDENLDAVNRFRVARVLQLSGLDLDGTLDDERMERLSDASLTPAARLWVKNVDSLIE